MGVIQRQGIKNVISNYFGLFLGYINILIIQPNFLSKDEVGLLKVLFTFSALLATFLPMGMNNITLKFFPQFRNSDTRHYGFFGLMLIFPALGFLFLTTVLLLFKYYIIRYYIQQSPLFTHYFNYLIPYILILGFQNVFFAYANSLLKTTVPTFLNDVVSRVILMCLTFGYYFRLFNLDTFVFLNIMVYGLQLILTVAYIIYEDRISLKIDYSYLKSQNPKAMIRYGFMLSFAGLTFIGLKSLDNIMLAHYLPLSVVAVFGVSAMIPSLIEAPLNALDRIAAPSIAHAFAANNLEEIKSIYYKSTRYLFLLGGWLFIGININIHSLFQLTAKDYASGSLVVLIISIGTLINISTGLNDSILAYSKKYKYLTYMLFFLFILAVINNMIFIPRWGIEGAAFATCLSSFIFNSIKFTYIWKKFQLQPFDRKSIYTLLLILLCFGINYFIPVVVNPIVNIIIRSTIVTIVYGVGVYLFRIVPEFHHLIPFINKVK